MIQTDPNQRPLHPSLQAKLELLENLQKGNMQRVRQLAYALSKVGRTNPELYGKLSMFVEEHKDELIDCEQDDDNQEPEIINVDDQFVEGKEWDSEQSIEYESDDDEENVDKENMVMRQVKKQISSQKPNQKKELFKQVKTNCQRRSVSNKKITSSAPNNTHQFKPSVVKTVKKGPQVNSVNSKPQSHKNSAIGKSKNSIQH